jgi:hypothetical protein
VAMEADGDWHRRQSIAGARRRRPALKAAARIPS